MQDKYEKALKDAKVRELMFAEEAAILEKVCVSLLAHRGTQAHKHVLPLTQTCIQENTHKRAYTHTETSICVFPCALIPSSISHVLI